MFSKEMEALIQATLEDGKLEENEKAALVKRAQKEGVDLDELEIYINSLLQKRQRELKEKNNALDAQYEKEKKEAIGPVCPKCGKQVPPLTLVCDCGYEFTKSKESKVALLLKEIEGIRNDFVEEQNKLKNSGKDLAAFRQKDKGINNIVGAISSFKVPDTKEDIVEFLSTAVPKARLAKKAKLTFAQAEPLMWFLGIGLVAIGFWLFKWIGAIVGGGLGYLASIFINKNTYDPDTDEFKEAQAWRDKFDQVMMKARTLRGDTEFTRQLDYYENMLNKE